jgi:AmmeMemoRadiSam system protein B
MSMRTRLRALPQGWYPESASEIEALAAEWSRGGLLSGALPGARAAIAPHAGWAFSGRIAATSILALAEAETVAVIGGHLPPGYRLLAAPEDFYETSLGPFERDAELYEALAGRLSLTEDRAADNTVEIQLPLLKALKPAARILWLRAPADGKAIELGKALAAAASELGRSLVCLGSTDLTHYGPDYGFEPAGRGEAAETWVRETSDRGFIDALLALDPEAAIVRGEKGAACSSGAAAAALAFALAAAPEAKAVEPKLLAYATSLEVRKAASFVGYASLAFY